MDKLKEMGYHSINVRFFKAVTAHIKRRTKKWTQKSYISRSFVVIILSYLYLHVLFLELVTEACYKPFWVALAVGHYQFTSSSSIVIVVVVVRYLWALLFQSTNK